MPEPTVTKPTAMTRMPRPKDSPRVSPMTIGALDQELRRFQAEEAAVRREYPWAERFVMGLPLAPWQRGLKWTEEQARRYITSAWTGVPLGSYVLTEAELEDGIDEVRHRHLANCVLDGQQRLHALELYLTDKLAVPDAAGQHTLWSELERTEQRWFLNRIFDRGITPLKSEQELREFYDLMNFGGVRHEEHERALPHVGAVRPAAPAQAVAWLHGIVEGVMDYRHTPDGMVRGGKYIDKQALLDSAALAAPQPAAPTGPLGDAGAFGELPEAAGLIGYTAAQMREYARQEVCKAQARWNTTP